MHGDFSRWTHAAAKRYRRVLQQQGRVLTDADWNEMNALLAEETRLLAADIIGPHGGPKNNCGFFVTMKPGELGEGHPNKTAFELLVRGNEDDLFIGAGHYWVDGLLCVLTESITYRRQPGYPPLLERNNNEFPDKDPDGSYVVYLEVSERHLTDSDDPLMRDPALTETCSRSQIVWQVKVARITIDQDNGVFLNNDVSQAYTMAEAVLNSELRDTKNRPKLKAQIGAAVGGNDPCILPSDARYRGRENQLYRVEIHQGGNDPRKVSWKWSRDNGSVIFPVVRLEGTSVVVSHLGRDEFSTLKAGDWVEILDDILILHNEPGKMARVALVERDEFLVTLESSGSDFPDYTKDSITHPFLRRWDHKGSTATSGTLLVTDATGAKFGKIEYGIEIQFDSPTASYRTGDYWLIPARTATGNIEWPANQFLSPVGIERHYAPLALLQNTDVLDIRSQFEQLAKLTI